MSMAPDDLTVGAYVTVLEWKTSHDRRDEVGRVLRIEAVDLPFVAVSRPGYSLGAWPLMLDTRECTLKRLSDHMVATMLGHTSTPAAA